MSTPAAPLHCPIPQAQTSPLWQTLQMILNPLAALKGYQQELGDVFSLSYMGVPSLVVLSDPTLVKALFAADPKLFKSGETNRQFMAVLLGDHSMLMLDGTEHQ